ncbi:MAG: ATP-binding cassette domain-containing protein [Solirubrobacterales bacterium]|nr:ATP-binding cassette domain-containing protein [Solirubrobacterales bacterium]
MTEKLLEIRGLVKHFPLPATGVAHRHRDVVHAVDGVDLTVRRGEFLALVGESGSGKTTLANCVAGFVEPTAGTIAYDGKPFVDASSNGRDRVKRHASRREMATEIQMVFQDPSSALNPRQTVESTLLEPLTVHKVMDRAGARTRVRELLELTGIPQAMLRRYPHELNSGQRQRVVIARALTLSPRLLVADEPVSRLDVSIQSQILNLLVELYHELGLTVIFITHDLSVVRQVADTVVVMYLGRVMEASSADAFFSAPLHPYGEALAAATPRPSQSDAHLKTLTGEIPSPVHPPSGCPFNTRCPIASAECIQTLPPLRERAPGHFVACLKR